MRDECLFMGIGGNTIAHLRGADAYEMDAAGLCRRDKMIIVLWSAY